MLFRRMLQKIHQQKKAQSIPEVVSLFHQSADFVEYSHTLKGKEIYLSYFQTMIDTERLNRELTPHLTSGRLNDLWENIPIENKIISTSAQEVQESVMRGYIMIREHGDWTRCLLVEVSVKSDREVTTPENEFSVAGPQEAFIESIDTNVNLIRKRLPLSQLKVEELSIGKMTQTKVMLLYIDGLADQTNINTMRQRLEAVEYDQIIDANSLAQMIYDNTWSIFPQLINTERPERVTSVLCEGKVAFFV